MSTEFFNDQWRIPNNENQNKVSNYSMEFNGTSDYVDLSVAGAASVPSEASSWTFSAWIWLDSGHSGDVTIFERGATYPGDGLLVRESNGRVQVYSAGTSRVFFDPAPGPIPTGQWTYFALVYDKPTTNLTCYVNTAAAAFSETLTQPAGWAITGTLFNIGKRQTNTNYWKGKIDQVSVFNYALPATGTNSIATLYGGGTTVVNPMSLNPTPVAYYQLGDQSVYNGANYLSPNGSLQGYVFDFDGVTNRSLTLVNNAALESALSNVTEFTFSAWYNWADLTGAGKSVTYLRNGANYRMNINMYTVGDFLRFGINQGDGFAYAQVYQYYAGPTPNLQNDQWFHYCGVLKGSESTNDGKVKLYLNGQDVGPLTFTGGSGAAATSLGALPATNNDLLIGGQLSASFKTFDGMFTNFQMWDKALTSAEVTTLYNSGRVLEGTQPQTANLQFWWKMDGVQDFYDGTNWNVKDYGPSGTNITTSSSMDSSSLVQSTIRQNTSGYSPYALNFDGTNQEFDIPNVSTLELYNTDFTISFWCKVDASVTNPMFFEKYTGGGGWSLYIFNDLLRFYNGSGWTYISGAFQTVYADLWTNVTIVGDLASTNLKCYINSNQVHSSTNALIQVQNTDILTMAGSNGTAFSYAGGLSNVAIWSGTALSAAEVTEVYNQGVPSDLNTFSGNKPNHWWQMGSNSSFNSSSWTCLDEGISASTSPLTSAVSTANMTNDDIIDGPGYSTNGVGTSSIDILGNAPYSTANGLSENMGVLNRSKEVPS